MSAAYFSMSDVYKGTEQVNMQAVQMISWRAALVRRAWLVIEKVESKYCKEWLHLH